MDMFPFKFLATVSCITCLLRFASGCTRQYTRDVLSNSGDPNILRISLKA